MSFFRRPPDRRPDINAPPSDVPDADIALTAREMVLRHGTSAAHIVATWAGERLVAGDQHGIAVCRRLLKEIEALLAAKSAGRLN